MALVDQPVDGGDGCSRQSHVDKLELATTLGRFLAALQAVPSTNGPAAGEHSFYRGASLSHYDAETREAIRAVAPIVPAELLSTATLIWEHALASEWAGQPVWFHGDLAPGNILIREGVLSGVIDFGTCGVGDPACDLAFAWTFSTPPNGVHVRAESTWMPRPGREVEVGRSGKR